LIVGGSQAKGVETKSTGTITLFVEDLQRSKSFY